MADNLVRGTTMPARDVHARRQRIADFLVVLHGDHIPLGSPRQWVITRANNLLWQYHRSIYNHKDGVQQHGEPWARAVDQFLTKEWPNEWEAE